MFRIFKLSVFIVAFAICTSAAIAMDEPSEKHSEAIKYCRLADEAFMKRDLEEAVKNQVRCVDLFGEAIKHNSNNEARSRLVLEQDKLKMLKASLKFSDEKRQILYKIFEEYNSARKLRDEYKCIEQLALLLKSLETYNKNLSSADTYYLEYALLNMIAEAYLNIGEVEKSLDAYTRIHEIRIKQHGKMHPDVLLETLMLSVCKLYLDDLPSADLYCRDYLYREGQIITEYNIDYAAGVSVLAMINMKQNRLAEAEALTSFALSIAFKLTNESSFTAARSYMIMAEISMLKGSNADAKSLFQKSLAEYKNIVGDKSYHYLDVLKKYAVLLKLMNNDEQAQKITNQANEILLGYKKKYREMTEK